MRVIRKILLVLTVISCFTECKTPEPVTQRGLESYGAALFQNFVYFISKDITLIETVELGTNLTQNDSGDVILYNREISLSQKTPGRFVKKVSSSKIEICFEELPDGIRPTITFIRDPYDKRYYIESTMRDVIIVDKVKDDKVNKVDNEGRKYGYRKIKDGRVILYNGTNYLLLCEKPKEIPYLKQDLNIKIIDEYRKMPGLR